MVHFLHLRTVLRVSETIPLEVLAQLEAPVPKVLYTEEDPQDYTPTPTLRDYFLDLLQTLRLLPPSVEQANDASEEDEP